MEAQALSACAWKLFKTELSTKNMLHCAFYEINIWKCANILGFSTQALVSFKKYMPPPLPYFKFNIYPFPLPLNIFPLFVILSLTQLYRYTPEIFLFSTATFKYAYRAPLRRIGQEYLVKIDIIETDTTTSGPV